MRMAVSTPRSASISESSSSCSVSSSSLRFVKIPTMSCDSFAEVLVRPALRRWNQPVFLGGSAVLEAVTVVSAVDWAVDGEDGSCTGACSAASGAADWGTELGTDSGTVSGTEPGIDSGTAGAGAAGSGTAGLDGRRKKPKRRDLL